MNNLLFDIIVNNTPKFNKNVSEGTAKEIFKTAPMYLNDRIESGMLSLSSNVDLKYLGMRLVNPKEEVTKIVFNNTNSIQYDIAKNDVYLVELKFAFQGKPFSRYQYLPYADSGNLIMLSDTMYHILPVLSDSVITPSYNAVFVRLMKAKITFTSTIKNFVVDGCLKPGEVINAEVLRVNAAQIVDNIGKPLVASSLYLAAKHGFREALKRYCGVTDYIITSDNVDHLRETYTVYEGTGNTPKYIKDYGYIPHKIKICITKKFKGNKDMLDNFIFGMLYTLDMFPSTANDVELLINNGNLPLEKKLWMIAIGRLTYKNSFSVDRMYGDVVEHFDALNGYVDELIKSQLSVSAKGVDDFFDLVALIIGQYNVWTTGSKEYNSSIENRYIDINYYIFYDIIIGFNRVILNINKRASKKTPIVEKEIIKVMNNDWSPKTILNLTKSSQINLAIAVCDYSADIKYPKITSVLEDRDWSCIIVILY